MRGFLKREVPAIIVAIIALLISLLVCVSIFFPRNIGNILAEKGDPVLTLGTLDVVNKNNCEIDSTGKYTITGGDPQLYFSSNGQEIECIKLNLTAENKEPINAEIYTAFADGAFSAERCYISSIFSGGESVVVDIPKGEYYSIRVDIDTDNVFVKGIELYDTQPEYVPFVPESTKSDRVMVVIIPIVIAVVAWLIEKYTKIIQRTISAICRNKLKLAGFVLFSIVAVFLGVLIEMIINPEGINPYRTVFLAGIAELVVIFVLGWKWLKEKPENIFLPVVLVFGIIMIFASPAKHIAWDFDSHYPLSVNVSYSGTAYYTGADAKIDNAFPMTLISGTDSQSDYKNYLKEMQELDEIVSYEKAVDFSLAHLPSGIFIAVARFFGANFIVKHYAGKLANLLIYAFVCYFAIRRIKSGKMILSMICMFPTCLYLATNYGYDHWVIAFSVLGLAYYVSELQEPDKPITIKDTVIMSGALALAAIPKLIYVVLMAMPLFMYKNWKSKKEKRNYYIILIIIFAIVLAGFVIRSMGSVTGSGDSRGGAVNPSAQIAGILSNPFGYARILLGFLFSYLSVDTMQQYVSHFAYFGLGGHWSIMVMLLMIVALTDNDIRVKFRTPLLVRFLSIVLFVGTAALIATAMYISFTPVGLPTVAGCQPRYLLPLLAPLLLLLTGARMDTIKNKTIYNGAVLAISSGVVALETYSQIITKMI